MDHHTTQATTPTLLHDLDVLHESYVDAVNRAVGADDLGRVDEMAAAYEAEVLDLVATTQRRRAA